MLSRVSVWTSWFSLRCFREALTLHGSLRLATRNLIRSFLLDGALLNCLLLGGTQRLLSAGTVLLDDRVAGFHRLRSVLRGKVTDLLGLLVDDLTGIVHVLVNNLLVGDVDEWSKVNDGREKKSQTPRGRDLDEEVGDKGGQESLRTAISLGDLLTV